MHTSITTVSIGPIGFDLTSGSFTNLDAYKAMVLKELCPSVNLDAAMNRVALSLVATDPDKFPDGSFGLFEFITKRLKHEQRRIEMNQACPA